MVTYRMIIGPDNSRYTETIPAEHIETLVSMCIIKQTEIVSHPLTNNETIIYRPYEWSR